MDHDVSGPEATCDLFGTPCILGSDRPPRPLLSPAAFTELLRPHYDDAARYCRLLCAPYPAAEAEDVFQEALVAAFEKADRLDDRARFRPWLFRIVQRTFLMDRRRRVVRRVLPLPEVEPDRDDLYDAYEHLAWKASLLDALARLGARPRATLLLHEVAGFDVREVSALLGDRSLSATKMRLARARTRMREFLADDSPVPSDQAPADLVDETLRILHAARGGAADD